MPPAGFVFRIQSSRELLHKFCVHSLIDKSDVQGWMAMKQQTFASQLSFEKYGRKSRRELFLDEMEAVVPWGS